MYLLKFNKIGLLISSRSQSDSSGNRGDAGGWIPFAHLRSIHSTETDAAVPRCGERWQPKDHSPHAVWTEGQAISAGGGDRRPH